MATRRPPKPNRDPVVPGAGLMAMFSVRMTGVLGELQRRRDPIILQEYAHDRKAHEQAVADAQAELDIADDDYDLAWAWHRLDEALTDLARFEARQRLARRRQQITKG